MTPIKIDTLIRKLKEEGSKVSGHNPWKIILVKNQKVHLWAYWQGSIHELQIIIIKKPRTLFGAINVCAIIKRRLAESIGRLDDVVAEKSIL